MAASMTPSRSIVIRSAPERARWTVGGSGTPATCPSSSVIHSHGVELDAELIGDQGADPDGSRRRVGADADTAAGQLVRRDPAALDVADEMRKRVAAEDDDRKQAQRHVTGAGHEKRHERQLRDVELEIADHPFEGLVRHRHVGEVEWHDAAMSARPAATRASSG